MKAVRCFEYGPPSSLVIEELPEPKPGPGEVQIRVRAAGVNFPDALKVQGKHQASPPVPFSPGHEVAGIVGEVGAGVDGYRIGDRVVANLRSGGFCECVVVKANHSLAHLPPGVAFADAAALPLAHGTSFHALCRGRVSAGETVLVLGASGGVGLAAVQIAKLLGAKVIACASSDEKLRVCSQHGADQVINYSTHDLRDSIRRLTDGKGIDVVIDPVGGAFAEPCVRSMAWNGRYVVVGFAAGEIPRIPLNLVLLKGCSIIGAAVGSNAERDSTEYRQNLARLIEWMESGVLKPLVSRTYRFAETPEAIENMLSRGLVGKAVVLMDS